MLPGREGAERSREKWPWEEREGRQQRGRERSPAIVIGGSSKGGTENIVERDFMAMWQALGMQDHKGLLDRAVDWP